MALCVFWLFEKKTEKKKNKKKNVAIEGSIDWGVAVLPLPHPLWGGKKKL